MTPFEVFAVVAIFRSARNIQFALKSRTENEVEIAAFTYNYYITLESITLQCDVSNNTNAAAYKTMIR